MERDRIEGFDKSLLLEPSELDEYIKKNILLKNFVKSEKLENFLEFVIVEVLDGYIMDDTNTKEMMKNKLFMKEDRYGRRRLIDMPGKDPEFLSYLRGIIDQTIEDSCVLFVEYSPQLFKKIRPMVSPSILLGNVRYLSNVTSKVNKSSNFVAFIFGYHCSKNSFWMQASIEKKKDIYNILL